MHTNVNVLSAGVYVLVACSFAFLYLTHSSFHARYFQKCSQYIALPMFIVDNIVCIGEFSITIPSIEDIF